MNDFNFLNIYIPLFSLALISVGLFLSFYKRKLPPGVSPTDWINKLNLPDYAKDIRRKEITKNTARIFTPAWFREYWRGERTALSAFFCWFVYMPLLFGISALLLAIIFPFPGRVEPLLKTHHVIAISIAIFFQLYLILTNSIWWKCAKNSTLFWKYLIRILAAINIFYSVSVIVI